MPIIMVLLSVTDANTCKGNSLWVVKHIKNHKTENHEETSVYVAIIGTDVGMCLE